MMSGNFVDPHAANLIGLWDFQASNPRGDTGLADGMTQNGQPGGDASISGGALHTGGCGMFDVSGGQDAPFNLAAGTVAVEFTQDSHLGSSPDTIVNRGEQADADREGWFEISVTQDGAVQVWHCDNGHDVSLSTDPGFFEDGDTVTAVYAWSPEGGLSLQVENQTRNTFAENTAANPGITMNVTDNDDESWTFGARETDDGRYGKHFDGSIDYVAIYDKDILSGGGLDPKASDDSATGDEDTDIVIDVLDNDTDADGDPLSVQNVSDGAHGTTAINSDGTITYSPDSDYNGTDTFSYTVSDGQGGTDTATVTVTVAAVNDAPAAVDDVADSGFQADVVIDVLDNDTDIDGDPLQVVEVTDGENGTTSINPDGTITYSPNDGFTGTDTFVYEISDGQRGTDTASVTVTIGADMRDGIVEGTGGDDLIDVAYTGDPDGDRIDSMDEILPGEGPNDDIVRAGKGNDTVLSGEGADEVSAGRGHDLVLAGSGDDELSGGRGDDTLIGGVGNDTIDGGRGGDDLLGGADRDTFTGTTAGDVVDGNETGDDFDTLDLTGAAEAENPGGSLSITYISADQEDGFVEFLDADGDVTGTMQFSNIENVVPCFTPDTAIATPRGEVPVQSLAVGDRVITRDNGLQQIRWIGRRKLSPKELHQFPHLAPVLIRAGSLGHDLPERDLLVSPQHRILVNNEKTALYFEDREILAAAKHLAVMDGVGRAGTGGATYIHFMFDQHEVVLSNGSWTESFQPGDRVLDGMGEAQRNEIYDLFPDLRDNDGLNGYQAARRSLKQHEAFLLVE